MRHSKVDWRNSEKSIRRRFALMIDVPIDYEIVEDVLDSIENDTLCVFHPDDERAFDDEFDSKGALLLNKRATLPVSIREWLCLGCQVIKMENSENPKCLAFYQSNLYDAVLPHDSSPPLGPGAFTGHIGLCNRCLPKGNSKTELEAFAFVVAHELVHVFDAMRYVVPAFMDWDQFWKKALKEGTCCDRACWRLDDKRSFLDAYASPNEMAMVAEFWPSSAKRWFNACRKRLARG